MNVMKKMGAWWWWAFIQQTIGKCWNIVAGQRFWQRQPLPQPLQTLNWRLRPQPQLQHYILAARHTAVWLLLVADDIGRSHGPPSDDVDEQDDDDEMMM